MSFYIEINFSLGQMTTVGVHTKRRARFPNSTMLLIRVFATRVRSDRDVKRFERCRKLKEEIPPGGRRCRSSCLCNKSIHSRGMFDRKFAVQRKIECSVGVCADKGNPSRHLSIGRISLSK